MSQLTPGATKTTYQGMECTFYAQWQHMPAQHQELMTAAQEACALSHSPYSQFKVGAALRLQNGHIIKGANQENAAYPSGLCAERVSISAAVSVQPGQDLQCIAVLAMRHHEEKPIAVNPCGMCRQVMLEYSLKQEAPLQVLLKHHEGGYLLIHNCADLLPLSFNQESL